MDIQLINLLFLNKRPKSKFPTPEDEGLNCLRQSPNLDKIS